MKPGVITGYENTVIKYTHSALTLMVWWQEGHLVQENLVSPIPEFSLEEDLRGTG